MWDNHDNVALDMFDDFEYTRPYIEALLAQILSPIQGIYAHLAR
jgi:hypothetical protein